MMTPRSYASGFIDALALVAVTIILLAAALLAGCSSERAAPSVAPTSFAATMVPEVQRGPILIRVRIVDTDPSDDVSLLFVLLGAKLVELMRGEAVQP